MQHSATARSKSGGRLHTYIKNRQEINTFFLASYYCSSKYFLSHCTKILASFHKRAVLEIKKKKKNEKGISPPVIFNSVWFCTIIESSKQQYNYRIKGGYFVCQSSSI